MTIRVETTDGVLVELGWTVWRNLCGGRQEAAQLLSVDGNPPGYFVSGIHGSYKSDFIYSTCEAAKAALTPPTKRSPSIDEDIAMLKRYTDSQHEYINDILARIAVLETSAVVDETAGTQGDIGPFNDFVRDLSGEIKKQTSELSAEIRSCRLDFRTHINNLLDRVCKLESAPKQGSVVSASDKWIDARFSSIEQRIAKLESAPKIGFDPLAADQIRLLNKRIDNLPEKNVDGRLEELDQEVNMLGVTDTVHSNRINHLNEDVQTMRNDLGAIIAKVESLERARPQKLSPTLEGSIHSTHDELRELESLFRTADKTITTLCTRVSALGDDMASMRSSLHWVPGRIKPIEDAILKLECFCDRVGEVVVVPSKDAHLDL